MPGRVVPGGQPAKHVSLAVLIDGCVVERITDKDRHVAKIIVTRVTGRFRSATDGVVEVCGCYGAVELNRKGVLSG